jgi:argininosuccinate lyase
LQGLDQLYGIDKETLTYEPQYEDLFFLIESKMGELIGDDLAGKIHMARSRNDMGEGMYRFVIREHLLSLVSDVDRLSGALLKQAKIYIDAVMPAHTHTQPAQPTTFGHYLLAIYDNLGRDRVRLLRAYHTVNHSPLGAAAITTTGFPISRERLAALLGFEGMVENSYDAIGAGDYLLESAQSVISLMVNMGRWIQEFLRFATHEVGLITVADSYVQISSIMPQKRNPVSIEHARSLASNAVGQANAVVQMLHNTPYGDIVDTEDDLQPTLYQSFHQASRVIKLMNAVVRTMDFNVKRAQNQASKNLIVITELADVLTRDHQISFRKSHAIATNIAHQSIEKGMELYEWKVDEINGLLGDTTFTKEEWETIVDPRIFVERRLVRGGPSPIEVSRMIAVRKQLSETGQHALHDMKQHLHKAKQLLCDCVKEYTKGGV